MSTATLTSKGQITVPKAVRDQLHLSTGDRVRFLADGEGRVVMVPATTSITELRGCLPAPARPVTLAEMDAAIAAGASEHVVGKGARKRKT
jgi:AbrB family looped-hinge helix DNA binding protein